ncbi:MAG: hypothetical protein EON58_01980 [Alphaproteobacteria bacterium]|nr:MAG: hypothetical protein EON58_01980 [Alphaproteobacteria bacterium]
MDSETLISEFVLDDKFSKGAESATNVANRFAQAAEEAGAASHRAKPGFDAASDALGGGGFAGAARLATAELDSSTPILSEVVSVLKAVGIAAVGAGIAIAGFSYYAMQQAASLDALERSLNVYMGTAEETAKEMGRLREIARLPGLGVREAIEGSVALQAIGADARLAERALMSFGNAIASAGGGKDQLQGVIVALSQIVSMGKVTGDNINQIANNVPQIRDIMKKAFGTANSEEIAKKVGPQEFVLKIIAALELLPKVAGSAQTSFENMGDAMDQAITDIGDALNDALLPGLSKVADFVGFLSETGWFTGLTNQFLSFGKTVAEVLDPLLATAERVSGMATGNQGPLGFMRDAKDFPDLLIRGASLLAGAIQALPTGVRAVLTAIEANAQGITAFVNGVLDAINAVIKTLTGGVPITVQGFEIGRVGGGALAQPIAPIQAPSFSMPELGGYGEEAKKYASDLYDRFGSYKPSNDVLGDTSPGGFRDPEVAIADATARTAVATEEANKKLQDLHDSILGGGTTGTIAASRVAVGQALGGRGSRGGTPQQELVRAIENYVSSRIGEFRASEISASY